MVVLWKILSYVWSFVGLVVILMGLLPAAMTLGGNRSGGILADACAALLIGTPFYLTGIGLLSVGAVIHLLCSIECKLWIVVQQFNTLSASPPEQGSAGT